MSEIELSGRGKRQLKSILYDEIKTQIDTLIEPLIKSTIEKRIETKLNEYLTNSRIESLVNTQIKEIYWYDINEMLQKADFQTRLKDEIIKYLYARWACGLVPFETQFNDAIKKAVKELISNSRG